jgi:hypothetical protein
MNQRVIFRWIHIIFSIPILGYIYSPFEKLPDYAPRNPLCFPSCHGPYGIVNVERPRASKTHFEETGLTTRCRELRAHRPCVGSYRHFSG